MNDYQQGEQRPPESQSYPSVEQSLTAARKLIGPHHKGTIKIIRRFTSVGVATWRIEAKLLASQGPDYEVEVEGDRFDEVAAQLVEALEVSGMKAEE